MISKNTKENANVVELRNFKRIHKKEAKLINPNISSKEVSLLKSMTKLCKILSSTKLPSKIQVPSPAELKLKLNYWKAKRQWVMWFQLEVNSITWKIKSRMIISGCRIQRNQNSKETPKKLVWKGWLDNEKMNDE